MAEQPVCENFWPQLQIVGTVLLFRCFMVLGSVALMLESHGHTQKEHTLTSVLLYFQLALQVQSSWKLILYTKFCLYSMFLTKNALSVFLRHLLFLKTFTKPVVLIFQIMRCLNPCLLACFHLHCHWCCILWLLLPPTVSQQNSVKSATGFTHVPACASASLSYSGTHSKKNIYL